MSSSIVSFLPYMKNFCGKDWGGVQNCFGHLIVIVVSSAHLYCHFFVILDLVVVMILGRRGQGERERREEPGGEGKGWAVGAGHPK